MIADTAVLTVDLDAIAANWAALRARHGRGVAGVLKADAYGLGAPPVARRLAREGCRHFFVAHLFEALAVRDAAPGAAVAVLDGILPGEAPDFAEHGILPVLNDLGQLDAWRAEAARRGRRLPAILHVDTGMNRLGLPPSEVAALAADPARLDRVDLRYVMTHLVAAEVPDDPANERQRAAFATARAQLPAAPVSFANSSGIFLGAAFASDLARPGAALYGINPTPGHPNPMRQAVRLDGRVLQVRDIGPGASVGYNGTWTATRPSRIATVAVGYADGYLRGLTNRGTARLAGRPISMAGRVSMDLTTFDITDLPQVGPGDMLTLIGDGQTPDDLATLAGTNGYEILTSLGQRYARRYLGA